MPEEMSNIGVADTSSVDTNTVDTGLDTNTSTQADDWFGELSEFALPSDMQGQEQQNQLEDDIQPEQYEIQEPIRQEDPDAGRYQYWQSQADRAARERDILMQQLAEYQQLKPVIDYINTNQDLAKQIEQHYITKNGLETQGLRLPAKPEKPANYNLQDLVDMNSDTYKYHKAMEEYQINLTEYMVHKDEMREQAIIQQQQQQMIARQQYERKVDMYSGVAEHVMRQGFDENTTKDFLRWASDDNNITLDNLLYAFSYARGITPQNNIRKETINTMRAQQSRNIPSPVGIYGNNQETDLSDAFGQTLIQLSKKY